MTSKLDRIDNIDAKLTVWAGAGHSLKRIAGEVEKLGVKVTDMTVQRRLRALGLATQNAPIASKTGKGAWLSQYRDEIVTLADTGNTYAEIWDRLAAAHPGQPQFQRDLGRDGKTSALAAWVHAERKRSARLRRSSLLDALPREGLLPPQYVVMPAAAGTDSRPSRAPGAAPVGQLVRPAAPQVPVAPAPGEPRFSTEARRLETEAMRQAQRAQEDAATSQEDKDKAARLRERFKT
ncbi:hypothetical protein [Roseateles sp. MS654]|uniref:hypothetical protein n=1 Tax=Roseateles sp. MS654 TaxID=3412685 RepID=UPI003C2CB087